MAGSDPDKLCKALDILFLVALVSLTTDIILNTLPLKSTIRNFVKQVFDALKLQSDAYRIDAD